MIKKVYDLYLTRGSLFVFRKRDVTSYWGGLNRLTGFWSEGLYRSGLRRFTGVWREWLYRSVLRRRMDG